MGLRSKLYRAAEPRRNSIGFIPPGFIEGAFIALLYLALFVLVMLSIVGTFYGLQGQAAPIETPLRIVRDVIAAPKLAGMALLIQAALTLTQYGARQFSRRDRIWWLVYLAALGISMYYNIAAYYDPMLGLGVSWYVALAIILGGDVIPEITAVQQS